MRPDQRWFPTNMTERAAWYRNFAAVFAEIGLDLGFTQAEIDEIAADNEMVQFLAGAILLTSTYEKSLRAFQRTLLLGKRGSPQQKFPAAPELTPPAVPATGVFERLERTVRRIRVAAGYTEAAGARLGIIPRNLSRAVREDHTPKLKVTPLSSPFAFAVSTTRLHYDMFAVEFRRANETEWTRCGSFVVSPATVEIVPLDPTQAELIYVRIRMMKGNDRVGNYSNIQTVALTP